MSAKQYLLQVRGLDAEINRKQERLEYLRCAATRTTPVQGGGTGGGSISDRIGTIGAKIADLDAEINADIDRLNDLKWEIAFKVNMLDNKQEAELLERHYVKLQSWKRMSAQMGIGLSRLHRIHRRALEHLEYIYYI